MRRDPELQRLAQLGAHHGVNYKDGDFTKSVGLEMDGSGFGLGTRSQRYSAILQDGVVTEINVEQGPGVTVSACEIVLGHL